MTRAFVRQIGSQPGVQLNPIIDRTDGGVLGVFDQTAALIGRFTRGRIDKPFRVNRSTLTTLLGSPASISLSLLNEAYSQAYEALQNGARELVVQRLTSAAAAISWATFSSSGSSTFAVSSSAPTTGTFGVQHLACHNDGIIIKVHADSKIVSGTAVANDFVTVQVCDAKGIVLHTIKGSLTAGSVDEFGQSNFLPDVAAAQTDLLVFNVISGATIAPTDDGYGLTATGALRFVSSAVLSTFSEGGTSYIATDYDRCITALQNCQEDFGYIFSGGSRSVLLLQKLTELAYQTNRQFIFDVPGDLDKAGAIAFVQSLGFGNIGHDHYPQAYWAPLKSMDPANGNKVVFGAGGAQVGFRCARNAATNAYGLAPKQNPIAGINGALGRANVTQLVALSDQDLSDLADARINPVIYQVYSGGGNYAFSDSLTCANTRISYRKLVSVAEMSSDIDERVARYARECLQLPEAVSIRRLNDYLEKLFGYAVATGWLVPSADPNVPTYAYSVVRNAIEPADILDVEYRLHYEGTTRQVIVQQSIV